MRCSNWLVFCLGLSVLAPAAIADGTSERTTPSCQDVTGHWRTNIGATVNIDTVNGHSVLASSQQQDDFIFLVRKDSDAG